MVRVFIALLGAYKSLRSRQCGMLCVKNSMLCIFSTACCLYLAIILSRSSGIHPNPGPLPTFSYTSSLSSVSAEEDYKLHC